ncbi:hypothetical protein NLG97_g4132 [Lecanicillium saksenae]|uniref:Uncharacterized protein n=1 Tax=Lecanicillium saksenae TaxID=468837 RepID=A0ACC1QXW6_9HYPO|nr:hypothetical protein NLG97_g4132 [Lecanicillium saksenae]
MRTAIIIGGGPCGLITALRLHQTTGIKCKIYEIRSEPTTLGGAIGITSNGLRLLDRLGVFQAMSKRGNNESTLTLHSMTGGVLGKRGLVGEAEASTGYGYMRIRRTDLLDVLLQAVEAAAIPLYFGKSITSIAETADNVTATFSDGAAETADILIGCDGIHSAVRRLHVDPSQEPHYAGYSGLGSMVATGDVAHEYVKQLSGLHGVFTTKGMLAAMPCSASKDQLLWFFSKAAPAPIDGDTRDGWEVQRAEEVANFKTEISDALRNGTGDFVEMLRSVVDATQTVNFYPIFTLNEGVSWHRGRCIILGDAAHAMSPSAGQGTSMAIEDAFLLSRLLKDPEIPLESVFRSFDRLRRPRVEELGRLGLQNASLRNSSSALGLKLKECALWIRFNLFAGWLKGTTLPDRVLSYDIDAVDTKQAIDPAG